MMFRKAPNITYTDMAIYVDEHIYKADCDDSKCFEYLYLWYQILAVKKCFFKTSEDYDKFAIYAASKLLTRYRRQDPHLTKIQSCLNYIKATLYPMKVDYQQTAYDEVFQDSSLPEGGLQNLQHHITEKVINANRTFVDIEVEAYLQSFVFTIKAVLKTSPYRHDRVLMHNLYLSCILTLLKRMTLSNKECQALQHRTDKLYANAPRLEEAMYRNNAEDEVILYHVDENLRNYVITLINKIKKAVSKDILYLCSYYNPSANLIQDILYSTRDREGELNDL